MRTARRAIERLEPQQLRWSDLAYGSCELMHACTHSLVRKIITYSRNDSHFISDGILNLDLALDKAVANIASDLELTQGVIVRGTVSSLRFTHVRLVQMVQNRISNALVYRRDEAPRIVIAVYRYLFTVDISITDNVTVFSANVRPRIFQPVVRGTVAEACSGLGLATCGRRIEARDGRIWVEPQVGCGSTFRFTVPAAD